MLRARRVVFLAVVLLAPGCTSNPGNEPEEDAAPSEADLGGSPPGSQDDAAATPAPRRDSGTPGCVPACGPTQVCATGVCTELPKQCPCPKESYCDLNKNQCVAGCTTDEDCNAGRYCDEQRQCRDGCRVGKCGPNEVCQLSTRTCECIAGHHRCGGSCVAEGVASCGPSCKVCPTDPFGTAACAASSCTLTCKSSYKMCGGVCAPCPSGQTASTTCDGTKCVASGCSPGYHLCGGTCVLEDLQSCGSSCAKCSDAKQGACSSGACYNVVDFGYYPTSTTCAARCASQGKSCGDVCDIYYTRPGGSPTYHYVAGGHYTQTAAFQPYGFLKCTETPPGGAPTSIRCCCTEQLTGTPKPGCTTHTDCKASEFCWATMKECYPTVSTNPTCPPGYTYKGQCSSGTSYCTHSGLPSGTVFKFEQPCPAGTTARGGFYCSGLTSVCVPN